MYMRRNHEKEARYKTDQNVLMIYIHDDNLALVCHYM